MFDNIFHIFNPKRLLNFTIDSVLGNLASRFSRCSPSANAIIEPFDSRMKSAMKLNDLFGCKNFFEK